MHKGEIKMGKTIKARYSKGVIQPLEKVDICPKFYMVDSSPLPTVPAAGRREP
jgi:hypothetical protein